MILRTMLGLVDIEGDAWFLMFLRMMLEFEDFEDDAGF